MKILKVIHGYPPLYNAGSEVYSQLLCHGLAERHEVHVFTREENPFAEDFILRHSQDTVQSKINLHLINIPLEKFRYRYQHHQVDEVFINLLNHIKPDVVHVGHLNHLSTSLIFEITKKNIPIIFTLHDYWLMCPRGQFIQRNSPANEELWALCDGQDNQKCAERCYSGYFSGAEREISTDITYWTDWVNRRMVHIRDVAQHVNCFVAPSRYLYNRYVQEFNLPKDKVIYLDYGFDLQRLKNRKRVSNEPFTFGYIGTHIPAKGIQDLISAFSLLKGESRLRIWGRPRSQNTDGLRAIASELPLEMQKRIEWLSEYNNENIVSDVFNHVDCIVVPSIWVENSPLVIHEALQVRVPVITANVGGMAEYVHHEKNGLLFEHRHVPSLAHQMQRLVDDPKLAWQLGSRGYLQSEDGNIPSLNLHISAIEEIYHRLIA
jgi:glycosyltransferase involved in cell wall biosynthesis